MASEQEKIDEIISLVAQRPPEIFEGMICMSRPVKPPGVSRKSASSSPLGNLEPLPPELVHIILAMLDFESLVNFSTTSLSGLEIVKSLPQYRRLMRHAPATLNALARTALLPHHSLDTIYTALRSTDCVSCGRYGAFLFLPTCQRCCYNCLRRNQSLELIPVALVKKCFPISEAELKTLPAMRIVPGEHFVGTAALGLQQCGLFVSVGAAKRLAISKGRSEEDIKRHIEPMRSGDLEAYRFLRFYQQAALEPRRPELFENLCRDFHHEHLFYGTAASVFPHLNADGQIEDVYWCFGCKCVAAEWLPINPLPEHLAHLLLPGCREDYIVDNAKCVARLRSEFLDHVEQCPGAKKLLRYADEHKG